MPSRTPQKFSPHEQKYFETILLPKYLDCAATANENATFALQHGMTRGSVRGVAFRIRNKLKGLLAEASSSTSALDPEVCTPRKNKRKRNKIEGEFESKIEIPDDVNVYTGSEVEVEEADLKFLIKLESKSSFEEPARK